MAKPLLQNWQHVIVFEDLPKPVSNPVIDTSTINKPRFSIRITVVGVFILATLLTAIIAIGLQFHFNRILAIQSTLNQFKLSAFGTKEFLSAADTKVAKKLLGR